MKKIDHITISIVVSKSDKLHPYAVRYSEIRAITPETLDVLMPECERVFRKTIELVREDLEK